MEGVYCGVQHQLSDCVVLLPMLNQREVGSDVAIMVSGDVFLLLLLYDIVDLDSWLIDVIVDMEFWRRYVPASTCPTLNPSPNITHWHLLLGQVLKELKSPA